MALTNQSKQTGIKASKLLSLDDLTRALREEVKKAKPLAANSETEYKRRAAALKKKPDGTGGWDMFSAGKNERYLMRAAGVWDMRNKIREKLNAADKAWKRGPGTKDERDAKRGEILADALKIAKALDAFREEPWSEGDLKARQQQSHKKDSATDTQMRAFFEAVGDTRFREVYLVTEFTGCRGEELAKGIRIEAKRTKGGPELHFFIESAKCDGDKKGLEVRQVIVPFPSGAAVDVQERWKELAGTIEKGKSRTVTLEPTEKMSAGERLTRNVLSMAKKAGLKGFSVYSLRHRVSSQTKAMGDAENTAAVLGHQSTETQRHYGRKKRGKGDVSPVAHVGVNLSGVIIRGGGVGGGPKPGPALHVKEQVALRKALQAKGIRSKKRGPRL